MITLFITLAIIGWVVSLTFAIKTIIEGWRYKNKEVFDGGLSMFGLSILFGLVLGWVLLVLMIKTKYIDKRFE
jgi:TRAP-type C4-dicarboxylate transport system permease small subunit